MIVKQKHEESIKRWEEFSRELGMAELRDFKAPEARKNSKALELQSQIDEKKTQADLASQHYGQMMKVQRSAEAAGSVT